MQPLYSHSLPHQRARKKPRRYNLTITHLVAPFAAPPCPAPAPAATPNVFSIFSTFSSADERMGMILGLHSTSRKLPLSTSTAPVLERISVGCMGLSRLERNSKRSRSLREEFARHRIASALEVDEVMNELLRAIKHERLVTRTRRSRATKCGAVLEM